MKLATVGVAASVIALGELTLGDPAIAQNPKTETVIVFGRALDLIGEAHAASEGVVGYADFEDRPLSRVGELVEVIPGAIATQHSGEGKANQYFLRGFNLDHGTDFSANVDGAPVNMRTHGHGQGYLDLNFLIPEVVEQVRYRKGPYSVETGDFSAAGSASFRTYSHLPESFAELRLGEFGYARGVAGVNVALGEQTNLLLAGEGQVYDGPWVLSQELRKVNVMAKLVHAADDLRLSLQLMAYDSKWDSSDQIPERAVASGLIDRFGFIDGDLGGATTRYQVVGNLEKRWAGGGRTAASAYVTSYDFELFSNFTYFLDNPVDGDEFRQRDRRWVYGGAVEHEQPIGERFTLRAGGDLRYDDIRDVGLFHTKARRVLSTVREDQVGEFSLSAWAEGEWKFTDRLRGSLGARADYIDADVDALSLPANGGSTDDAIVSPTAGLAWKAMDQIELYANYGQGYHSNDVRGATIAIDPSSGDPADPVPIFVRSEGAELGARIERELWNATLSAFWLHLDSELVFVGDAGTTEPNDATRRYGVELSGFWTPTDWLALDASAAWTDAKFDIPGSDDHIPGAIETVLSGGAVVRLDPWTLSLRVRHFGKAPLIEDNSVRSDPTTVLNLAGSYDWRNLTFGVEVLNLLDAEDADITYFYESRLPGEAAPVADRHFHPIEPRQLRASVRVRF